MAEKPARLDQRQNGYWYYLTPGNSRGRSTGTRDVREAQAIVDGWKNAEQADKGVKTGLTIHAAIDDYMGEHVRPNVASERQADLMALYFKSHFAADYRVADIRDEDIDEPGGNGYIQKRRECRLILKKADPVPASDGSLRREIGFLASAFEHAGRKKDKNGKPRLPKSDIPYLPRPKQPPPKDRYLTREEENTLVAACPMDEAEEKRLHSEAVREGLRKRGCNPIHPAQPIRTPDKPRLTRIYRFLLLALHTAARKEAIETLMWPQIDLNTGTIDLNPVGRQRTNKRRPVVRIPRELMAVLKRAFDERTTAFVLDGDGDIRTAFETLVERSGLPDVTPHTLRHTWATRAAQAGVPMREIADWLGDNIATVERNYYKRSPHYLKDAIDWREREERANTVPIANPGDTPQ